MPTTTDDRPSSSLHPGTPTRRAEASMQSPSLEKFPDHNHLPNNTVAAAEVTNGASHPHYRSFKKKFLKIRHGFEERMRTSNEMFENEDRLEKISRRLKEQNDALRELLVDINDSKCIPSYQRFDLNSPANGHANKQERVASISTDGPVHLSHLDELPQSTLEKVQADGIYYEEIDDAIAPSYFSPSQEEEYIHNLDVKLGLAPPIAAEIPALPLKPVDRDREHYKDVQLRNPVSVYNWLKRNRPEIFLQETSDAEDVPKKAAKSKSRAGGPAATALAGDSPAKPSPKPAVHPRSSKRARAETIKQEEVLDDDGNVLVGGYEEPAPKNKRKREDEPYRPKGGSSKRKKRKTASGGTPLSKEMVDDTED